MSNEWSWYLVRLATSENQFASVTCIHDIVSINLATMSGADTGGGGAWSAQAPPRQHTGFNGHLAKQLQL